MWFIVEKLEKIRHLNWCVLNDYEQLNNKKKVVNLEIFKIKF